MRICIAIVLTILAGCATNPPVNAPTWSQQHKNACVPEAAAMAQELRSADISAHVLLIYTPAWAHAVCVYCYPSDTLWVWDANWKSIEVRAFYDNPAQIARAWLAATNRGSTTITSARFLE